MRTIRINVLMLCLISAPLACGVVVASDVPPPDQVIVQAKRGDLVTAAKEVQLLEQRFFQRYNELNSGTTAAFIEKDATRPDFQNNVRDVVNKNPELVKLLQEHDAARQRYEALYRELNGPKEAKADTPAAPKPEEAR